PRPLALTFALVSLAEMIVGERVVRIGFQDAFIFGAGFVHAPQFEIRIRQTILKRINVPFGGAVLQGGAEMIERVLPAPLLQGRRALLVLPNAQLAAFLIKIGRASCRERV